LINVEILQLISPLLLEMEE